jgi:acyl carrier protein
MYQDKMFLMKVVAFYQLARGIFGQSLSVFPIDLLFRLLLCSGGILAFTNRRIGYALLVVALILSIPQIEVFSSSSSFYWPPVRFIFPTNIGFALYSQESVSNTGIVRVVIDGIYIILLITLTIKCKDRKRTTKLESVDELEDELKAQVFARVRRIISDQLGVYENYVKLSSHLIDDLGPDDSYESMGGDFREIIIALEEEFDIEISDSETKNVLGIHFDGSYVSAGYNCTVRNFVNFIHKKLHG